MSRMPSSGPRVGRREFLARAAAIAAVPAWACRPSTPARASVVERRDLYPEGVASGDPEPHSVLLWTRRPFAADTPARLRVEVSEDASFARVVATADVPVSAASDWTCRVLVGNLQPSRVYWYRFIDEEGHASRIGRTRTAPTDEDVQAVRFAFVSCQNINLGSQHAYRRMIFEDERAPDAEQLGFVLHLGDFIYELVWYPEDQPHGRYHDRRARDVVRYPHGERVQAPGIGVVHIPTTVDDYRVAYRAYLQDPDIQDARARWPFVCIWDNHEFSSSGWQSMQVFNGEVRPAQTRKVAANQAWFEYQPARIAKSSGPVLDAFDPPKVEDAAILRFDDHGFGDEPNNRTAVASLRGYRALRWGRHLDLLITDQWSHRSQDPAAHADAKAFMSADFPQLFPEEALEVLDAGRAHAGGKPPETIRFGDADVPNFRKDDPPQTLLGAEQKAWFLQRLKASTATWKIWGCSLGTLDYRVDPQNLPGGLTRPWPGAGFATFPNRDHSTAYRERAEIYAQVRDARITGFATVCGDRHSFWAGLAAPSLPPRPFEPVGVAFVTGSVSTYGFVETLEHTLPPDHPLRALYLAGGSAGKKPEPAINLLLRRGVRSCLEYQRTGDLARARELSNPDLAPHLAFVDCAGHGYATVRVAGDALECEFVCIPRPSEHVADPDGGPLLYRIVHRAPLWSSGQPPRLEQRLIEGNPVLSL